MSLQKTSDDALPTSLILKPVKNYMVYDQECDNSQIVLVRHGSRGFKVEKQSSARESIDTTWRGYATGKLIPRKGKITSWVKTIPPRYLLTRGESFSWIPNTRKNDGFCLNLPPLSWDIVLRMVFDDGPSLRASKLRQVPTLLEAGNVYRVASDILPEISNMKRTWFGRELALAHKLKSMCVYEPMKQDIFEKNNQRQDWCLFGRGLYFHQS